MFGFTSLSKPVISLSFARVFGRIRTTFTVKFKGTGGCFTSLLLCGVLLNISSGLKEKCGTQSAESRKVNTASGRKTLREAAEKTAVNIGDVNHPVLKNLRIRRPTGEHGNASSSEGAVCRHT